MQEVATSIPTSRDPPTGERNTREKEKSSVSIVAEFVALTSPEAAKTMCRAVDETAYATACGQSHTLQLLRRKRPRDPLMSTDCDTMMRHGLAMKAQVGC